MDLEIGQENNKIHNELSTEHVNATEVKQIQSMNCNAKTDKTDKISSTPEGCNTW